jgi:hypothetical protein
MQRDGAQVFRNTVTQGPDRMDAYCHKKTDACSQHYGDRLNDAA